MTPRERTLTEHMLALQNELDAERVRRWAETQRADRERARRLAEAPCASDGGEAMLLRSVRVALGLPPMFTGVAGDEPVLDAVRRLRDDAGRCDVCAKEGVTLAICGECSVADHAKKASGR